MPNGTCTIIDGGVPCLSPVLSREMCSKHYGRWNKHGDPLFVGKMGRPKGPVQECSEDDCHDPVCARGWCEMHYRRWQKSGDPQVTKRIIGDIEARFWSKVDRRGDNECWPWLDAPNNEGYGVFGVGQKVVKAHRWAYEHFVEPIPAGLMPDHLCHDPAVCNLDNDCPHRLCVNYLRHLEVVTNRENVLRGARTKLSDEVVATLYARWRAGEKSVDLAAEVGTHRTNLLKRFRRVTNEAA